MEQRRLGRHVDAVEDQVGPRGDVVDVLLRDAVVVHLDGRVRVDLPHPLGEDRSLVPADVLEADALAVHVGDVVAVGLGEDQVLAAEPDQGLDRRAADRAAAGDQDRRRADPLLLLRRHERRVPRRELPVELVVGRERRPVSEHGGGFARLHPPHPTIAPLRVQALPLRAVRP